FQPKPPSSSVPDANTNIWFRTSGTSSTCLTALACSAGVPVAAGLSAARLIVALTRRTEAATAMTRGTGRIRVDTARESEASKMRMTPLMGEVDDVGVE